MGLSWSIDELAVDLFATAQVDWHFIWMCDPFGGNDLEAIRAAERGYSGSGGHTACILSTTVRVAMPSPLLLRVHPRDLGLALDLADTVSLE